MRWYPSWILRGNWQGWLISWLLKQDAMPWLDPFWIDWQDIGGEG